MPDGPVQSRMHRRPTRGDPCHRCLPPPCPRSRQADAEVGDLIGQTDPRQLLKLAFPDCPARPADFACRDRGRAQTASQRSMVDLPRFRGVLSDLPYRSGREPPSPTRECLRQLGLSAVPKMAERVWSGGGLERAKGFEPSTPTLARLWWHHSPVSPGFLSIPNALTIGGIMPYFCVRVIPSDCLNLRPRVSPECPRQKRRGWGHKTGRANGLRKHKAYRWVSRLWVNPMTTHVSSGSPMITSRRRRCGAHHPCYPTS